MTRPPHHRPEKRRAFTLMESVVVITIIALAVPGLLMTVRSTNLATIDQQRRVAGSWLASSVLESVQADAASPHASRGFVNLNGASYLTDPTDGLYARLSSITTPYQTLGITYQVTIGSPIDLSGAGTSAHTAGALREIVATITFTDQSGRSRAAEFKTLVVNL